MLRSKAIQILANHLRQVELGHFILTPQGILEKLQEEGLQLERDPTKAELLALELASHKLLSNSSGSPEMAEVIQIIKKHFPESEKP